jgi:hypothetical protein
VKAILTISLASGALNAGRIAPYAKRQNRNRVRADRIDEQANAALAIIVT